MFCTFQYFYLIKHVLYLPILLFNKTCSVPSDTLHTTFTPTPFRNRTYCNPINVRVHYFHVHTSLNTLLLRHPSDQSVFQRTSRHTGTVLKPTYAGSVGRCVRRVVENKPTCWVWSWYPDSDGSSFAPTSGFRDVIFYRHAVNRGVDFPQVETRTEADVTQKSAQKYIRAATGSVAGYKIARRKSFVRRHDGSVGFCGA